MATAESPQQLELFVQQRVSGLPLEHVVGWAEFAGMRIAVDPGVFVPRPRTEHLVARARDRMRDGAVVLDLCCGSGAIGVAVVRDFAATLVAADFDPAAVANARRNVEPLGGRVFESDVYDGLPEELRGTVDILTVVAPYVPTDAVALLPHEARDFEPLTALDGGADGLALVRRIVAGAPEWLAGGGILVTEISENQVARVLDEIGEAGMWATVEADEDSDSWVVVATQL